jgi:hypothetical protein
MTQAKTLELSSRATHFIRKAGRRAYATALQDESGAKRAKTLATVLEKLEQISPQVTFRERKEIERLAKESLNVLKECISFYRHAQKQGQDCTPHMAETQKTIVVLREAIRIIEGNK